MERYKYNRIQEVLDEKDKDVYWLLNQLEGETIPRVVRWCKNVKQPTIEELFEISRVLEIDVRELIVSTKTQLVKDNNDSNFENRHKTDTNDGPPTAKIEILQLFQGKENVRHIVSTCGSECFLSQKRGFFDETSNIGACKLNTIENETKHVLFLFNSDDTEVGRYYIGKKLQGKSPAQILEMKRFLCFFESWNLEMNKWVPCVGLESISVDSNSSKKGCGLTTNVKNGKWYVVDEKDNIIVHPGKYDYIDGFDKCGLARVKISGKTDISNPNKSTHDNWGIIDTKGNEVLPVIYSEIWNFFNKNRETTIVWKGDIVVLMFDGEFQYEYKERVYRYDLNLYTHELILKEDWSEGDYNRLDSDYNWAPSDQYTIWDALDGEPEAAGNIDYEW